MGFRSLVSRSTLADANEVRDWRIYSDFAQVLITRARDLYRDEDLGIDLRNTVYALDSTIIDLCFSLFPWATYKPDQHAVKLHTLLDLRGKIPTVIRITPAQLHDVLFLDHILLEPGAFYVMDRGYLDFARLYRWTLAGAFFVTRAKKNFQFRRVISHEVDKTTGVQCDQTILLKWFYSKKGYPERLRRVRFLDPPSQKRLVFLTNNFVLPAKTIADLYRSRWHVELFFKWIKQHLRIKAFFGTSPNALKTQVWTAVCAYVLAAIVKKRLNLDLSLYTILQILSVSLFEKTPILQAFSNPPRQIVEDANHNQLELFNI
jgi:transposase